MATLNITVTVPDSVDPSRTDPHEVAELILDVYNEELDHIRGANMGDTPATNVTFVSAEWAS